MYVVIGATGHTGAAAAATLRAQGHPVRAVVRNADKAAPLRAQGAEIAVADLADTAALTRAFQGAKGAYVMNPPAYAAPDVMTAARATIESLAAAIAASDLPHVTLLSSLGAERAEGTGVVRTLHEAERRFAALGRPITYLRAAYFMENWAAVLGPARQGVLPTGLLLDRPLATVAVKDIGEAAARSLVEPAAGPRVLEVVGPAASSPIDVAAALGRALGTPVQPLAVPLADFEKALLGAGFSPNAALLMRELVAGLNEGRLTPGQPGAAQVRGRTSLDQAMRALAGT